MRNGKHFFQESTHTKKRFNYPYLCILMGGENCTSSRLKRRYRTHSTLCILSFQLLSYSLLCALSSSPSLTPVLSPSHSLFLSLSLLFFLRLFHFLSIISFQHKDFLMYTEMSCVKQRIILKFKNSMNYIPIAMNS